MRQYYYTDKLLLCLAITNLWMFIPSLWGTWCLWSLIHATEGDTQPMFTLFLWTTSEWFFMLGFSTLAFFKRWRWMVVLYVIYLSKMVPATILILVQAWQQNDSWNSLYSRLDPYTHLLLWVLCLITIIVMLIETDYKNLLNKLRRLSIPH